MSIPGDIRLRQVTFLSWDDPLPVTVGPSGPAPGSGAIEIPGSRQTPTRTWLEPTAGPAGVAGRIVDPDGTARPVALGPDGGLVALPAPPSAVAPRAGGVWALTEESLTGVDADGSVAVRTGFGGVRLIPAAGDAVWLLGSDTCRHIAGDGTVTAQAPWSDPFNAAVAGADLCGWEPGNPTGMVCVAPDGTRGHRDPGRTREAFERLLAFGETGIVTALLRTLVYRDPSRSTALALTGAGLTSAGQPFLAGEHDGRPWLWRAGAPPLPLPAEGRGQVLQVAGDRVLVRAGEVATWWEGDVPVRKFPADELTFRDEIFPAAWLVSPPFPFSAGPDGSIVVAASGPTGIAVLTLRWPPNGTGVANARR
ncbi:MAG TPA: hypothetical protein VGX25_25200 [Actinophytocola sp.]|uniref:hypothetical protein n=1 Tax=Actinophytocola sp. TaxID=1872138 RepID=UPI002DDD73B7|nr:hypothetical protein [Actinophytocola sp.]HEV2782702.1 hypothetical protein [Actinophytocola sp.]